MSKNAIDAYLENRKALEVLIAEIQTGLENRKTPLGAVTWGHVGDLQHYRAKLQDLADSLHHRGEYSR